MRFAAANPARWRANAQQAVPDRVEAEVNPIAPNADGNDQAGPRPRRVLMPVRQNPIDIFFQAPEPEGEPENDEEQVIAAENQNANEEDIQNAAGEDNQNVLEGANQLPALVDNQNDRPGNRPRRVPLWELARLNQERYADMLDRHQQLIDEHREWLRNVQGQ